jgi:hypothetical protein
MFQASGDILKIAITSVSPRKEETMTQQPNPRALGFNYGIGWGSEPKPAIYEQGCLLAKRLADQANEASRAAWTVEHALRAVRLAETNKEKADAAAALTAIVFKYDLAVAAE